MYPPFFHSFDIISLFAAELEEPKKGIWRKGLNLDEAMHEGVVSRNTDKMLKVPYKIWFLQTFSHVTFGNIVGNEAVACTIFLHFQQIGKFTLFADTYLSFAWLILFWFFSFIYRRYRLPIWATSPEDG